MTLAFFSWFCSLYAGMMGASMSSTHSTIMSVLAWSRDVLPARPVTRTGLVVAYVQVCVRSWVRACLRRRVYERFQLTLIFLDIHTLILINTRTITLIFCSTFAHMWMLASRVMRITFSAKCGTTNRTS